MYDVHTEATMPRCTCGGKGQPSTISFLLSVTFTWLSDIEPQVAPEVEVWHLFAFLTEPPRRPLQSAEILVDVL